MVVATLVLIWLFAGLLAGAAAVYLMADGLLRPPRMNDGKAVWLLRRLSPGDLGLRFEETSFTVIDETSGEKLRLAAWWIPAPSNGPGDRCVILLHGYADAKVGAIAWAPTWHSLGFHILALDLRAHGESDGDRCTGGQRERFDANQVIDQLRQMKPQETRQMVLFGVSFGAAVAAATAVLRDDIAAVVLDSPYDSFAQAAMGQMDRLGAPGRFFQRLSIGLAGKIAGVDFNGMRTSTSISALHCPTFVIAADADHAVSAADAARIADAVRQRGERYWSAPEAGHALALVADPMQYRNEVADFLDRSGLAVLASRR